MGATLHSMLYGQYFAWFVNIWSVGLKEFVESISCWIILVTGVKVMVLSICLPLVLEKLLDLGSRVAYLVAIWSSWTLHIGGSLAGLPICRTGSSGRWVRSFPLSDIHASQQLRASLHVRKQDIGMLRGILAGGVHNFFWNWSYPLSVQLRESCEVAELIIITDQFFWPRCLLWQADYSCVW